MSDFKRKQLPHGVPDWVPDGSVYFITINCRARGRNQLAISPRADAIFGAFRHYESLGKWYVRLGLIMPDHLHALISFNNRSYSMSSMIQSFKSYLAKTAQIKWQKNYFDHRLRDDAALWEKAAYIRQNPVRAGLVKHPDEWPYLIEAES